MSVQSAPRWQRRRDARPAEILAAALAVFTERGFAGARLEEIAARARISKGSIYMYFDTKQALFEAVVHATVLPDIETLLGVATRGDQRPDDLLRMLGMRIAAFADSSRIGAVMKIVIGESQNFPELARFWHAELVSKAIAALTALIERGQAERVFRDGDPRLFAIGIMAPIVVGEIWRETFVPVGAPPVDLSALIQQHLTVTLDGMRWSGEGASR